MPPPPGLQMNGLVMFGSPGCVACDQAARWLEDGGYAFRKYDVNTSPRTVAWLVQEVGVRNVPVFFFNGHHLAGAFAQVQQLGTQGELPKAGVHQL